MSDLASLFPAIEREAIVVYMVHPSGHGGPACEYLEYRRGAFTSLPDDEFCRVFDFDDRHPGGGSSGPFPAAFDDEATSDLASLKREFARVGLAVDYLNVVLTPDGSVGPDSGFSADRCVNYWYQPGWVLLPEDVPGESISRAIDADWYKTDYCP